MRTPQAEQNPWADLWALDPTVAYLNHGSFGACPKVILEHQAELRARQGAAGRRGDARGHG